MTVTSTRSDKTALGNGATTVFPYDFKIPSAAEVSVYLTNLATGNVTVLTAGLYSISGLDTDGGGDVTYPLSGSPLAAGNTITIERVIPYTQTVDVPNQGNFFADVVEAALDRVVMQIQQVQALYERTLRVPTSDDEVDEIPNETLRANKTLGFDANGAPMVGSVSNVIVSAAMTAVVQAATTAAGRVAQGFAAALDGVWTAASLSAAIVALFTGSNRVGSGVVLTGTATIDLASAASGRTSTGTVTVAGAAVGDVVLGVTASGDATTLGGFLTGMVTAADTVTIFYMNGTAGALNPASQDYTVRVLDVSTIV